MSIRVIARIWAESEQSGGRLLVLLALADFSHDDGTGARPSIKTLAKKARLSPRQTQNVIRQLEETGELKVSYGTGLGGANEYTLSTSGFTPAKIAPSAETAPAEISSPVSDMREIEVSLIYAPDVATEDFTGAELSPRATDSREGVLPVSPKPLIEPLISVSRDDDIDDDEFGDWDMEWYVDLHAIPGFKEKPRKCIEWFEDNGVTNEDANRAGASLRSKWPGPKTAPYRNVWATMRNWSKTQRDDRLSKAPPLNRQMVRAGDVFRRAGR